MIKLTKMIQWDKIGIFLSGLCVVHCLVTPILLVIFPFYSTHSHHQENIYHQITLFLILLVGYFSFFPSYKKHKNKWILFSAIFAISLLTVAIFTNELFPKSTLVFNLFGGTILIITHFFNIKCTHATCHHH